MKVARNNQIHITWSPDIVINSIFEKVCFTTYGAIIERTSELPTSRIGTSIFFVKASLCGRAASSTPTGY